MALEGIYQILKAGISTNSADIVLIAQFGQNDWRIIDDSLVNADFSLVDQNLTQFELIKDVQYENTSGSAEQILALAIIRDGDPTQNVPLLTDIASLGGSEFFPVGDPVGGTLSVANTQIVSFLGARLEIT